jgi:hypothetical protein
MIQNGRNLANRETQNGYAGAAIEVVTHGLPFENWTFVLLGPFDFREFIGVWKFRLQLTNDVTNGRSLWLKNNRVPTLFNDYFAALESKSLRQAHRLAASVLEKLGCRHIYNVYLHLKTSRAKSLSAVCGIQRFLPDFL